MILRRILDLKELLEKKSHFLFGPRGTGKTTLIRETLAPEVYPTINLLHTETRLRLLHNPSELRPLVAQWPQAKAIVIDEVQKIPQLLDEIHDLIEDKKIKFLLTGSSARKLKHGGANLLAGRARLAYLSPLTSSELAHFDLDRVLQYGTLPAIVQSEEPFDDLRAYVDTYLQEEVQQEAKIRNLVNFTRFLYGAALQNGELLNFAKVGSDASVSESTVRSYYQILEDTLLGEVIEPFRESKKRKTIQTAKFYFFDSGVTHAVLGLKQLQRNSPQYGKALEQWVYMELRAYLNYHRTFDRIRFWRTVNGQEVDFLIGEQVAIEVKAGKKLAPADLSGLRALKEEKIFKKFFFLSQDPIAQEISGIQCIPIVDFLKKLWAGRIL